MTDSLCVNLVGEVYEAHNLPEFPGNGVICRNCGQVFQHPMSHDPIFVW